ncbi:hypothetical protein Naga_100367g2 [Nannochloropsis gaditana]|uniref:Uncharacterized protein n=1 Tax=Nannochloropsis gaditana TaxID=72520 RepID=W7TMK9_9STRA|nr:hypothetical protein Naga_100367g2 [Nannochloropsis gaditana]
MKGEGRSRSTGPDTPPHVPPTPPASSSLPSNRLYAEAARQRERLARRIADTRVPECTFHPTLVSRAASTSRTRPGDRASEIPFVDRAQSYQRHVESKLSALRKEQAAQEQPSFRPTLPVHTGKKGISVGLQRFCRPAPDNAMRDLFLWPRKFGHRGFRQNREKKPYLLC